MDSKTIIKILKEHGWYEVKLKRKKSGTSHAQFKHPDKPGRVTVPRNKKGIPLGTIKSIERQAGIKIR
jgi:predicted RNA binding protein YcfA (HicA-like mRNA interferase family)